MPSVCRFGGSCGSLAVCRMPARTTQRKSRIGPDAWKRCCANGSPPVPKTPRLCVSAPDPKNRPWKSGRLRPSIMTSCGKWNVSSIWRRCPMPRRFIGGTGQSWNGKRSSAAAKIWRTPCVWRLGICMGRMPIFRRFSPRSARRTKRSWKRSSPGLAGRLSMLADEEEWLADSLRTQEVRLEQAEGSETLSRLRLRAASLSGTIRGLGLEWSRYALARHLLLEARGRFEKERQPGVIRAASALFSAITGGAWVGIAASLEDSSLRVLPPHGEPVSPEVLSRGTQEQLYLALRLAHIRNHAAQAAALPVIMDDVLVNFDPDRALRTAQTFGDLASSQEGSPGHQLLYFTCHPHMADMLRRPSPASGCMSWRGERSGKRKTGNGRFEVAVVLRDLSGIFSFCGLFLESLRLVEEIAGGHSVPGQCPVGRQRL